MRLVGGPGASDGGDCLAAPCATIGRAIAQADSGDTIQIAAGNYDEQLTIDKRLTLQGDAAGATTIGPAADEGVVPGSTVKLGADASGTVLENLEIRSHAQEETAIATSDGPLDDVTLEGVTVRGLGPSGSPPTVGPGLEISVPANGWQILDSSFEGDYEGILVTGDASAMTIERSRFDGNRVGIEVLRSTPLGPDSTGTIDGLTLRDSEFDENQYRGLYFEGLSDAAIEGITVTDTGKGMASLPSGAVGLALNLKAGAYGDIAVSDSAFSGSVNEGLRIEVRGSAEDSPEYQAAPATLESFALLGSTVTGNGGPGVAIENEPNLEAAMVSGSRIAGNGIDTDGADAPVTGIFAWNETDGTPIAAADNWFGCNAGPLAGGSGCDTVDAPVAAAPWLVLTATASTPALAPGGSSAITAAIASDSAGQAAGPAPDGTPISFAADTGTIAPAAAVLLGGAAAATFTATAPGDPRVTVAVDGQRVEVPLSVVAPPPVHEDAPSAEEKHSEPPAPPAAAPAPAPASIAPSDDGGAKVVNPNGGPVTVATVACGAESCKVEAARPTLKVSGESFPVKVKIPRHVEGGDSAPVRVVLPKQAREALEESGKGRVRIRVTVTATDGTTKTVTLDILLKVKPRHRNTPDR